MVDEEAVDILQQSLQPRHILGLFRPERVQLRLGRARRMHPPLDRPLDPQLAHRLGEPEPGADDADGPHDRCAVHQDLVRRAGQPVPARGRDVLDKGQHGDLLFLGQPSDARRDQRRLHRRPAGRIDLQRDGHRLALGKRPLDHGAIEASSRPRPPDRMTPCRRITDTVGGALVKGRRIGMIPI